MRVGKTSGIYHFPITKKGIVFTATGILLLIEGTVRGELAATICGTALVLYSIFVFFSVLISFFFWKNILVSSQWMSADKIRLHIASPEKKRPFFIFWLLSDAFYTVRYITLPEAPDSRIFYLQIPITEPESVCQITLPRRGRYTGSHACIKVMDFSGFYSFAISHSNDIPTEPLIVFPEPETRIYYTLPPGKSGNLAGKSTFRRSDNLYETRQYMPGDDPRKINWKVYAHTGELSIRDGELLPPPSDEYIFFVTSNIPSSLRGIKRNMASERFDILVNRATRLALDLAERNRTVSVLIQNEKGEAEKISVTPSDINPRTAICNAFASYQLGIEEPSIRSSLATYSGKATILVFSMPEQVFSSFISSTQILFLGPVLAQAIPPSCKCQIRKLLFTDPPTIAKYNTSAYNFLFDTTLSFIKKGDFHVETI